MFDLFLISFNFGKRGGCFWNLSDLVSGGLHFIFFSSDSEAYVVTEGTGTQVGVQPVFGVFSGEACERLFIVVVVFLAETLRGEIEFDRVWSWSN